MSAEPDEAVIVKAILSFPWDNYGLDEVADIRAVDADYARALAKRIAAELRHAARKAAKEGASS